MNVHIYPSHFTNESRIFRIAGALLEHGVFTRVLLLGIEARGLRAQQVLDSGVEIERLPAPCPAAFRGLLGKVVRTVLWSLHIMRRLRREQVACVNCHSLAVLPICVWIKVTKRCRLVYDTHELETETLSSHGLRRVAARIVERSLIGFADCVAVVGEEIGKWYMKRYGIPKVWVIQNMPVRRSSGMPVRTGRLQAAAGLAPQQHERIFLYQGLLSEGRGIEIMLEVFSSATLASRLVLMGHGPLEGLVRAAAAEHGNIHHVPTVPSEEVMHYTVDADVGLCLTENSCLSHYLSLPNKFFEYLAAGVPVISSDFPEMASLVARHGCGWVTEPTAGALAAVIAAIDAADVRRKAEGARQASPMLTWDREQANLLDMYRVHGIGDRV